MPDADTKPNPGSDDAILAGCTCPVLDNGHGHGSGRVDEQGMPCFWIREDCSMHGLDAGEEKEKQ